MSQLSDSSQTGLFPASQESLLSTICCLMYMAKAKMYMFWDKGVASVLHISLTCLFIGVFLSCIEVLVLCKRKMIVNFFLSWYIYKTNLVLSLQTKRKIIGPLFLTKSAFKIGGVHGNMHLSKVYLVFNWPIKEILCLKSKNKRHWDPQHRCSFMTSKGHGAFLSLPTNK